ncbi:MAG: hypothetical protein K2X93_21675 [Candidatus Obscuribacterales bacterium]|nr:hypothetical protein [Candidatus Obscuribacterales bacterium]
MILEAFSEYLHNADPAISSTEVLARWLWEKLSTPPQNNVDQVIHCEIIICRQEASKKLSFCELLIPTTELDPVDVNASYVFRGSSRSGERLLKSLREYGLSYEQQKLARWVHNLKASDFRTSSTPTPDESD